MKKSEFSKKSARCSLMMLRYPVTITYKLSLSCIKSANKENVAQTHCSAGILEQSMGARNRVGIGLS
jgi:hypothetical protein